LVALISIDRELSILPANNCFHRKRSNNELPFGIGALGCVEEKIGHLYLVLRSFRNVHRLVTRAKDPEKLLRAVCKVLVEGGGFGSAWIAFFGKSQVAGITAEAGLGREFLPLARLLKQGELAACAKSALKRPGVVLIEEPASTCGTCPLAGGDGRKLTMTAWLEHAGKLYEEKALVREVAADIAHALYRMEVEKKYRRILENLRDVYYEAGIDGTILEISPSVESLLRYKREELIGKSLHDIYTDPAEGKRLVKEILEKGKLHELEISLTGKEGSKRNCSITAVLVKDKQGNPVRFVGTVRDISKRKKLESRLNQAQKMETIGLLSGGVAHDFNNLLTTIMGNADLALMSLDKDASHYGRIEEIRKASDRAADLTRQLLAFSRKELSEPRIINLNEVIKNWEKTLRRLIGEDIELVTAYTPEPWAVKMCPAQVDQMILNLSTNARDAMPKGGKLTIETANVELDRACFRNHGIENEPGPYVMLAVTDTGVGMDEEVKERIFEPFFTTKEMGKGTGLGLSTVYGIVKRNQGHIWVYSEEGKGTTFKVYLPRADAEREEKEEELVGPSLSGAETILLVEDDGSIREMIEKVLKGYGYSVITAKNGREAIMTAENPDASIDLVVTDVVMPGMSGPDLAGRLESMLPGIKALYMCGYPDGAIVRHGVLEDNVNFIRKPFTGKDLARKIREVLSAG